MEGRWKRQALDDIDVAGKAAVPGSFRQFVQNSLGRCSCREAAYDFGVTVHRDEPGRKTREDRVPGREPITGQAQESRHRPAQPVEEKARPDVREISDGGFGHGENGLFAHDAMPAVDRDAHSSAEAYAVYQ